MEFPVTPTADDDDFLLAEQVALQSHLGIRRNRQVRKCEIYGMGLKHAQKVTKGACAQNQLKIIPA